MSVCPGCSCCCALRTLLQCTVPRYSLQYCLHWYGTTVVQVLPHYQTVGTQQKLSATMHISASIHPRTDPVLCHLQSATLPLPRLLPLHPPCVLLGHLQDCTNACDDDAACAAVLLRATFIKADSAKTCLLVYGDSTPNVGKRSTTRADPARFKPPTI